MYGCSRIFRPKEILAEAESLSVNLPPGSILSFSRYLKMFDPDWVRGRLAERESQTSSEVNQSSESVSALTRDSNDVVLPIRSLAQIGKSSLQPLGVAVKMVEEKQIVLPDEIEYLFHDHQTFEILSGLFWGFTLTRFEIDRMSEDGRYSYDNLVFHRGHAGSRLPLSTQSEAYDFLGALFSKYFFQGLKLNFHWKHAKEEKLVACDVSISTPIKKSDFSQEVHTLKQEGEEIILC